MSFAAVSTSTVPHQARRLERSAFDRAYAKLISGNRFFEEDRYYDLQRPRYWRTLQWIARLPLPERAKILEIGGGQISLLCAELFDDVCVLADVNDRYADAVKQHGVAFRRCDLLHDDLEDRERYDLVVLCEVIEHIPVPPHIVFEKIKRWMRRGGALLLTTPNLYRLRNTVRLALGMPVFGTFFYPERGQSLGRPLEYSREHLQWHLERAGFERVTVRTLQLSNAGATPLTQLARWLLSPLQLRPLWRDSLLAVAHRPETFTHDTNEPLPRLVQERF